MPVDGCLVSRLNDLQVPRTELLPEKPVDNHQSIGYPVFTKLPVHFLKSPVKLGLKPISSNSRMGRLLNGGIYLPAFDQPESIPYFITEISSLLGEALVEEEVVTGRRTKQHSNPDAIGTVLFHQLDGIG